MKNKSKHKKLTGWADVQTFNTTSNNCISVVAGTEMFPRKKVQQIENLKQRKHKSSKKKLTEENIFSDIMNEPGDDVLSTTLELKIKESMTEELNVLEGERHQAVQSSVHNVEKVQETPKKKGLTLQDMSDRILNAVYIIKHEGNLYHYTGTTYRIIPDAEELLRLTRSCVSLSAFGSSMTRCFQDLLSFMRADDRLIPEDYDTKLQEGKYYVVFKNGVLDLRTMKLQSHSKDILTFYELNATWSNYKTSDVFCSFLSKVSGDDREIQMRILESMGYMFSGLNKGKCYFVMGPANNSGKSTLGALIRKIMGEELVANISTYQLGNRFALGNIHGKMLNMSLDLPKGKLPPVVVSIVKQVSGGDALSVEAKYDKLRDVHSNMRFLFASNYPVTIPKEDDDDAFWDRMVVIPFLYTIPKNSVDIELMEKMYEERDDIIHMSLVALHGVINNNFIFSQCKEAEKLKNKWRYCACDYTETINDFMISSVVVTGEEKHTVYLKELYETYLTYCNSVEVTGVTYTEFKAWIDSNVSNCKRKRIHHTGENPRAGYSGMYLKESVVT